MNATSIRRKMLIVFGAAFLAALIAGLAAFL